MTHSEATEKLKTLKLEKILSFINSQKEVKPLIIFDLETTGVDTQKDKIVSISVIKIQPTGEIDLRHKIVNPGVMMSDEVIEIHGVTNEQASKEPTFDKYAKAFASFISGCNLGGFNSNHFDKPILARELKEAGIDPEMALQGSVFIDVSNIYRHFNRRRLQDAVMRYLNEIMSDAHSSAYDSIKTMEVLEAMMWEHEGELPKDIKDMAKILMDFEPLDFDGKIGLDRDGVPCFTFGKYRGKSIESIIGPGGSDQGYYSWFCGADFSKGSKKVLSDLNNSFRRPQTPQESRSGEHPAGK